MPREGVHALISGLVLGGLTGLALARFGASIPLIIGVVVVYQFGLVVLELVHGHPRVILNGWFAGFLIMLIGLAAGGQVGSTHPALAPTMLLTSVAVRLLLEKVSADLSPPSKRD